MCGRYTITTKVALLGQYFDAQVPAEEIKPNYNVTPSMRLPVILDESPDTISLVQWGFHPHWDKTGKLKPQINARLETAAERPMFRDSFKRRHCLVLADGFYEWKRDGIHKTPYRIKLKSGEPFAMAGIWDAKPTDTTEQESSFAILTTNANEVMTPIHNRMPVILQHGKEDDWLIAEGEYAPTLKTVDSYELVAYEVSRVVNSPLNNRPEVVEPVQR